MNCTLNSEQQCIFEKFKYENYIKNIVLSREQLLCWQTHKTINPAPLKRDVVLAIEAATRGQSKNDLWLLLRMDRRTATMTKSHSTNLARCPALIHGNTQESRVKNQNRLMFDLLCTATETLSPGGVFVKNTILECGMFLSELGLHSASPDAYFELSDKTWIPVEIKCPFNYRDTCVDQIRSALGNKKQRYRVKHTALSVNKMGKPIFQMEKTDVHYRQIQRQLYVMKSPFAFYIVKFKNDLVVTTVYRDEDFFKNELRLESNAFVAFALQNATNDKSVDTRMRSFEFYKNNHEYTPCQFDMLAKQGLYVEFGYLKCAYCNEFTTDSREPFVSVIAKNHLCYANLQQNFVDNIDYFDYDKRYDSLKRNYTYKNEAEPLAYFGWYLCKKENTLKTFCCGVKIDDEITATSVKHLHKDDCKYFKTISK
jgi:hypothetical protein